MSLNGDSMDSGEEGSQPPSPTLHVDQYPDVDGGLGPGAGGGGGASVPDLMVPVPAAPTNTVAGFGSIPCLQPPGPQNLLRVG
jgi:hypothetical protein